MKRFACVGCGGTYERRQKKSDYCSPRCPARPRRSTAPCVGHPRGIDPARTSPRARRQRREQADGLSARRRLALLHEWRAAGRKCTYCGGPCDSVDHIVPLARDGTNRLDNLTPACLPCNTSKGAKLLSEWRPDLQQALVR